mmetsp:Transcript_27481/g.82343  ORF Transcript_27481/g.82343 Transcript_27481/m.82343 type:complete len:275 (-) Transcript_27481:3439-4263(-)
MHGLLDSKRGFCPACWRCKLCNDIITIKVKDGAAARLDDRPHHRPHFHNHTQEVKDAELLGQSREPGHVRVEKCARNTECRLPLLVESVQLCSALIIQMQPRNHLLLELCCREASVGKLRKRMHIDLAIIEVGRKVHGTEINPVRWNRHTRNFDRSRGEEGTRKFERLQLRRCKVKHDAVVYEELASFSSVFTQLRCNIHAVAVIIVWEDESFTVRATCYSNSGVDFESRVFFIHFADDVHSDQPDCAGRKAVDTEHERSLLVTLDELKSKKID